jgi:uncharacterized damage-inducible protein DinB
MNTKQAIRATMDTSSMVLSRYLDDLSDADLMRRPGPGCNHIAWQLGHLISSENQLLEMVTPGSGIELPEGFAAKHSKDKIGDDNPANFCTKQEYLDLFEKVHQATNAAIENLSDTDLDKPAPENFRSMFPTAGHIVILIATHGLMHAGQLVPVRRALGKPVVI